MTPNTMRDPLDPTRRVIYNRLDPDDKELCDLEAVLNPFNVEALAVGYEPPFPHPECSQVAAIETMTVKGDEEIAETVNRWVLCWPHALMAIGPYRLREVGLLTDADVTEPDD